jgi:hypothetical protein
MISSRAYRSAELIFDIKRSWWVWPIDDGTMKQINLHNYYMLGKALDPLFVVRPDTLKNDAGFDAIAACAALKMVIREDSVFLPGKATELYSAQEDSMASGIGDFARKVANRAETVVGDDARAVKDMARTEGREDRYMYRHLTGKDMATGRPKARKPAGGRTSGDKRSGR